MKPLWIFGAGEFANIAHEYFNHDSKYEVSGFIVTKEFKKFDIYKNLPVKTIDDILPKLSTIDVFVAISAGKMNTLRESMYRFLESQGASFASYISSKAFVWKDVIIGKNVFIFENNVIQNGVKIGDNSIFWSGNHIGHQTVIGNNCFISSHVVVSGYCKIEDNSYIGVNATLIDHINLARKTLVGAGAVVSKDTVENSVYVGNPAKAIEGKKSEDVKFN